jgi:hypothetical protein
MCGLKKIGVGEKIIMLIQVVIGFHHLVVMLVGFLDIGKIVEEAGFGNLDIGDRLYFLNNEFHKVKLKLLYESEEYISWYSFS